MSPSYESSRRRGAWGHWVPLVVTVTVATVGAAAWVWSQRNGNEEQEEESEVSVSFTDLDYETGDYGDNAAYGASGELNSPPSYGALQARSGDVNSSYEPGSSPWAALRRSPSPQQFLDTARRTVAAGVTAAGAAVGSALAAIREEDKPYADHETWSEEAEAKKERPLTPQPQLQPKAQPKLRSPSPPRTPIQSQTKSQSKSQPQPQSQSQSQAQPQLQSQPQSQLQSQTSKESNKRRKKVAIVISADHRLDDFDSDGFHEHASILSHIPRQTDFSKTKLYILIYAPHLKETGREASNLPPPSLSSSFSNIEYSQTQTPADESKSPLVGPSSVDPAYNAIYTQAQALVEKESMILTYTTPNGHSHILRHIQPEIIYLQESLAGDNGSIVTSLQNWLRHDIILVVGAESGEGGLADSESEAEKSGKSDELWWHREDRVGRGRGVVVVDGARVQDDWARRVLGKE